MVSHESRVLMWILSLRRSGWDSPTDEVPELVRVTEMEPSSYGYKTSGSRVTLVTQTWAAASMDVDEDVVDDEVEVDEVVDVLSVVAADTADTISSTRIQPANRVLSFMFPPCFFITAFSRVPEEITREISSCRCRNSCNKGAGERYYIGIMRVG